MSTAQLPPKEWLTSAEELKSNVLFARDGIVSAAFSPDARSIALTHKDGTVCVRSTEEHGRALFVAPSAAGQKKLDNFIFTSDGSHLLNWSDTSRSVRLLSVATGSARWSAQLPTTKKKEGTGSDEEDSFDNDDDDEDLYASVRDVKAMQPCPGKLDHLMCILQEGRRTLLFDVQVTLPSHPQLHGDSLCPRSVVVDHSAFTQQLMAAMEQTMAAAVAAAAQATFRQEAEYRRAAEARIANHLKRKAEDESEQEKRERTQQARLHREMLERRFAEHKKVTEELQNERLKTICSVCLKNIVAVVYSPCDHAACCLACDRSLHAKAERTYAEAACLICHQAIEGQVRVTSLQHNDDKRSSPSDEEQEDEDDSMSG